jgi:hypothetical protein
MGRLVRHIPPVRCEYLAGRFSSLHLAGGTVIMRLMVWVIHHGQQVQDDALAGKESSSMCAGLTHRSIVALAVWFCLTSGAGVAAADPQAQDLAAEIAALKAKVAQLESQQARASTDRSDERLALQQVRDDAAQRSTLFSEVPFAPNYQGGKFLLQSEDRRFVFHPWLQYQVRHATSYRDDVGGSSDVQSGFELRRMKFGFDGNLYGPDLTYCFDWGTSRTSGVPVLEEGWAQYRFARAQDWAVRGGQFKNPVTHEGTMSSKKMLAVDRPLGLELIAFSDNLVQGVTVLYEPDPAPFRFQIAFTDGSNSANTSFQSYPTNVANFGFSGRAQYKLMGNWKDYESFSPLGAQDDVFVLGAGGDWTQSGSMNRFIYTFDAHYLTAPGKVGSGQLGAFGALIARCTDDSSGSTHDWTLQGQASYLMPNRRCEPFVRYDYVYLDTPFIGNQNAIHEITGGVNYYIHGQNAKFTLDLTYLPHGAPSNTGTDVLLSSDAQWILRTQFQLLL